MIILKYFARLFSLWTTIAFAVVDVVLYGISAYGQTIAIPREFYWFVAGVGFVAANIQLYSQMDNELRGYKSREANIVIKLLNQYMDESVRKLDVVTLELEP